MDRNGVPGSFTGWNLSGEMKTVILQRMLSWYSYCKDSMITSGKNLTCLYCCLYICNCCKVTPLWTAVLIVQFAFLLEDNGSKWTELWEHYLCKSSRNLKEQYSSLHHCKNKHFWWVDFTGDVFPCMCTKPPVSLALQLALGVKDHVGVPWLCLHLLRVCSLMGRHWASVASALLPEKSSNGCFSSFSVPACDMADMEPKELGQNILPRNSKKCQTGFS